MISLRKASCFTALMGFRKIITWLVMFWKNECLFYEIEAASKYMLYLPPETEPGRNQAGVQLPIQLSTQSDDMVQRLLLALTDGEKPSSSKQKYRLTDKGRAALNTGQEK
ncbi:MAG: hypothetical protein KKG76_04945 [Euryarchaeota archaeon]|nr:hypothetical protein [Euryarchaeota archaeon]